MIHENDTRLAFQHAWQSQTQDTKDISFDNVARPSIKNGTIDMRSTYLLRNRETTANIDAIVAEFRHRHSSFTLDLVAERQNLIV